MFGYTPCPCFRKLLKTHLSVRHARCWTTPHSVGVLPQIILFISSLAFRALSCIPCTPNTHWSWWRYKRQAFILCWDLLSFLLILPPGMGSAVLNAEDWGFCVIFSGQGAICLPEFSVSSALLWVASVRVWYCMCFSHGHLCFLNSAGTNALFLKPHIQCHLRHWKTLIPSTYHHLKKSLLQCLWYVYYIIVLVILSYLSLLKTDLAKLIRGNLHSSYSLFTYLWTANCRNAFCSLKFPIFAHFPFDSTVVKESCA